MLLVAPVAVHRRGAAIETLGVAPGAVDPLMRPMLERERSPLWRLAPYGERDRPLDLERPGRLVRRLVASGAGVGNGRTVVTAPAVLERRDLQAPVALRIVVTLETRHALVLRVEEPGSGLLLLLLLRRRGRDRYSGTHAHADPGEVDVG
jgi:hypothetical protein